MNYYLPWQEMIDYVFEQFTIETNHAIFIYTHIGASSAVYV